MTFRILAAFVFLLRVAHAGDDTTTLFTRAVLLSASAQLMATIEPHNQEVMEKLSAYMADVEKHWPGVSSAANAELINAYTDYSEISSSLTESLNSDSSISIKTQYNLAKSVDAIVAHTNASNGDTDVISGDRENLTLLLSYIAYAYTYRCTVISGQALNDKNVTRYNNAYQMVNLLLQENPTNEDRKLSAKWHFINHVLNDESEAAPYIVTRYLWDMIDDISKWR